MRLGKLNNHIFDRRSTAFHAGARSRHQQQCRHAFAKNGNGNGGGNGGGKSNSNGGASASAGATGSTSSASITASSNRCLHVLIEEALKTQQANANKGKGKPTQVASASVNKGKGSIASKLGALNAAHARPGLRQCLTQFARRQASRLCDRECAIA